MMGPEHGILGAVVSHLGFHQKWGARITGVLVVASLAPDADSLAMLGGRQAFYVFHRTLFHSFLGVVVLAALLAGLCRVVPLLAGRLGPVNGRVGRAAAYLAAPEGNCLRNWPLLFGVALLGMAVHLGADIIYPWELPLLWPFASREFVFPLVDWGDRIVLTIMVGSMFGLALWRGGTRRVAVASLAALGGYLLLRATVWPADIQPGSLLAAWL
ncbi:MAG: metal-dependent hydrolase [Candidatus Brocadiia bacterium]